MSMSSHAARRSAVAVLWLGTSFAGSVAAAPTVPAATVASAIAPVASQAPTRPSAELALAVFDRQLSRSGSAHVYRRHPYSRHWPSRYGYYSGYRPYYRPYYYGYPFSFYGAWGYPAAYGGYGYEWSPDAGALDLNIKPKRAEVWVDREYLGTVDSYDGFPRYLWLKSGKHHVVVYLDGYETFAREVTLRAGEVLAIRFDLREGTATEPEELFATLEPERDEAASRADREPRARPVRPVEPADRGDRSPVEGWRDRGRAPRVDADQRAEPGRLRLVVSPADAVVYLDGRLLGSGEDLRRLHSDLLVDAGAHRLEATRPGYRAWQRDIEVGEGEEVVVEAELERDR
jgi:hypothetical protein